MKKIFSFVIVAFAAIALNAKEISFNFTVADSIASYGITVPIPSKPGEEASTNLGESTFGKEEITVSSTKVAKTDNRIFLSKTGGLSLRTYVGNTLTFTSGGEDITQITVTAGSGAFKELSGQDWTGKAKSVTLTCTEKATITKIMVYVGEAPVIWEPDTISVSEAIQLVKDGNPLKDKSHYVVGVVAEVPFMAGAYYCTNLADTDNTNDTIQAFNFTKDASTKFTSIEEMQEQFVLGDTVLVFTPSIMYYDEKAIYELNGGYYVETLGKSQVIDITEEYPYSLGATYVGRTEKGAIKYDVLLTKTEDTEEGLHLIITTNDSLAIAGPHTLYNDSYIDGETDVCNGGNAKLTYVSNDGNYNKYNLSATFGFGEKNYKINREYAIAGLTAEFDPIDFANDRPFIPAEGDTITGAQALSFAKSLGGGGIESDIKVYVHGWVSSNPKTQKPGQLQFYMDDVPEGTKNSPVQAYYCYEQGLDSIVNGDEVLLYGKIQLFKEKAEVSNGQIYRLNDGPHHARNIECVEEPDGAISVARAMEIGKALIAPVGQTVETPDVYTVVGYIAKVSYQTKNDTATWFMTDEKGATFGDLQAYKCYIPAMILAGDKVMVTGKIAKYQKSADAANIEFAKGTGAFVCEEGTDLEVIKEQAIKLNVNKVIMNGQFFILKDGKMFDGRGNVVVR